MIKKDYFSVYVNGDWVIITKNNKEIYSDTKLNFESDSLIENLPESAEYNTNTKLCILDGEDVRYNSVPIFREIIEKIDLIVSNKIAREE